MTTCAAVWLKADGQRQMLGSMLRVNVPLCFCGNLDRETSFQSKALSGASDALGIEVKIAWCKKRAQGKKIDARPLNKFATDLVRCLSHSLSYLDEQDAQVRGDAMISFEAAKAHAMTLKLINLNMYAIDFTLKARLKMEDQARFNLRLDVQQPLKYDESKDDGVVSLVDFQAGEDPGEHFADHFPSLTRGQAMDIVSEWALSAPQSPCLDEEVVGRVIYVSFPSFAYLRAILLRQKNFIVDGQVTSRFITLEDLRAYFYREINDVEFQLTARCIRLGGTYWTFNFQDRDSHNVNYLGGAMGYIKDENLYAAFAALATYTQKTDPSRILKIYK